MIRADEIRYGNKILSAFGQVETVRMILGHEGYQERADVHEIYKHLIGVEENGNSYNLAEIKPVPLNIEWLIKFGFLPVPNKDNIYRNDKYQIAFGENTNSIFYVKTDFDGTVSYVYLNGQLYFVHQLQNLLSSLENKNFTIKAEEKKYMVTYQKRVMDCDNELFEIKSQEGLDIFRAELKNHPFIHDVMVYRINGGTKIETKNDLK